MQRLISVTHGVTEAQAVQYWYRILDIELRRGVRDATLMSDSSSTLAHVFTLSEKIELNMLEERVVTSTFARDTTITSCIPHSTTQSCPMGGGSGSHGVHTRYPSGHREPSVRPPLPSFPGEPQGPSCWTCKGGHMRKGHGGDAPRGRVGRGGKASRGGRGIGAIGRTVASATFATESAMAARIEQFEHRLAAMAGLGASTSTSYEGEDFSYLASAEQVEASVAMTKDVPSSAVMRMVTSILRSPLFSATELIDSGIGGVVLYPMGFRMD
ncbi:hypothetical protein AXG93_1976s1510 [Marchantia polymorpha subsp. ruderalis]|uniref:Uncharacterized protein n=1 Tax=Marchantia polymorpha subsp. ruderalis TaxID=1480154 RepID=A0A176VDJ4_MARPO|nr:hypothetical protein AXG93_1976s1510 [Marchantia polymorpha subsp. ruderalis]